jgi:tRNA (cytosine34-C5)-methyltransferase
MLNANAILIFRCYMLTHQAKRLQSPSVIITNHDASIMPNFMVKPEGGADSNQLVPLRFDR